MIVTHCNDAIIVDDEDRIYILPLSGDEVPQKVMKAESTEKHDPDPDVSPFHRDSINDQWKW